MIYLKKVEVDKLVARLILQIGREPQTYAVAFLDKIDGSDHPVMQAIGIHGFIAPIFNDGNQITMALSAEGWEFWHQIIAIATRNSSNRRERSEH